MGITFLKTLASVYCCSFFIPLDAHKSFCMLAMIIFSITKNELCGIHLWCYQVSHFYWKPFLFSFWTLSEIIPHRCTSISSSLISLAPAFVHISNNAKKKKKILRSKLKYTKIFAYKTPFKFALSSMLCIWDAIPSNCSTFIAYHVLKPDQIQ